MPRFLANLDMYRKVPVDLLEGSRQGSIVSWMALIVIVSLAFMETRDYFTSKLQTDLALDRARDKVLLVNFNITMLDLKCEYVSIDVVSFLGKQQNVTKNVEKWAVSAEGIQEEVIHRNLQQHDIRLMDEKVTQTIEELHDNGEHAISLDETTLKYALEDHEFVFVDFFASWYVGVLFVRLYYWFLTPMVETFDNSLICSSRSSSILCISLIYLSVSRPA